MALVGRTEGGKALSREAAFAVMGRLHKSFIKEGTFWNTPTKAVMNAFDRIVTLSISDANK
eukprot:COSAG03_NODE_26999_length_256_cov_0.388535_1_plen_60_part_10